MAINRYSKAIDQSLEKYVPLPLDAMFQAGEAIQKRGDLAQLQADQTEIGLASLEAYAPAQREFVNAFTNEYKTKASSLLDKYHSNAADPQFIRESRKLNMQFINDPRLKIIKETNDKVKFNEQIAARMQAEGKLFIKPEFTGADANGNLTANVGNVQGVNTLDEWTKAGQIAHASTEEIGTTITNKNNLDRWKKAITGDVEGQAKLARAFMQQGMTAEQAANAVKSSVQGLVNQYGIESKINTGLLSLDLQRANMRQNASQFAQTRADRIADQNADRANALEIARLKAQGKEEPVIKAPSFNPLPNRIGAVGALGAGTKNSIIGSGTSQYGTERPVKNEVISGKIYDITAGETTPKAANVNIENGTLTGYMNVWTYAKDGKLITMSTPTAKPNIITLENGKRYITKGGQKHEVVEKTVAKYDVFDKPTDDGDTKVVRTIYKEAAPKEAMREMGYSNAYWEGMGRVSHGAIIDSQGKAKPDWQYINKHIANDRESLMKIKEATNAYNAGTATEEHKMILQALNDFDARKNIYDLEILPYFKEQSKTKTIVEEE